MGTRDHVEPASWRNRGMTLIELMVVVVIVGILVAIGYPSYQRQVEQSRRADGKTTLLTASQQLERCFTRFHAYDDAGCAVAADISDADGMSSLDQWYVITDTVLTPTAYTLVATPQGAQASDTRCTTLSLTHTGVRAATGTTPDRCW